MRRASTSWLAWGLFGLVVVLTALSFLVDATTSNPTGVGASLVGNVAVVVSLWAFAVVGALVASRQPRNADRHKL